MAAGMSLFGSSASLWQESVALQIVWIRTIHVGRLIDHLRNGGLYTDICIYIYISIYTFPLNGQDPRTSRLMPLQHKNAVLFFVPHG